ncbi:MAG TPA: MerR family transcriptional regulator [Acidimicrobiales bacterium]|jgi:DNA-binding transcriptional MerR regulator|nr:MerR family transcriptional regulator [Acidimicrobiales bacterium]
MAELARASGCSVATVKYYLRERLISPGTEMAATQADYGEAHVERLRLIRVLREVGDVPISRIGAVLAAIDDTAQPMDRVLASAHHALGPLRSDDSSEHQAARRDVVDYIVGRGWNVDPAAPALDVLAGAVLALRRLGSSYGVESFEPFADAAFEIARWELETIDPSRGPTDTVTQIVVGTVVFEHVLLALRRLAEEHHSNQRFGGSAGGA